MGYKLTDLLDIPKLQELLDSLELAYDFVTAVLDLDGNVLTASGWHDICVNFHRKHPDCAKKCRASDLYILDNLDKSADTFIYKCANGLIDCAFPIIVDGKHLGNMFVGQFLFEAPDVEFFLKQAQHYGFDEEAYMAALDKVPILNREDLDKRLSFIKQFTEFIAATGLKSLKELEAKKQLQDAQEIAHLGSWSWDIRNDRGFWSDELYRIFGVDPQTFHGSEPEVNSMIHPDDLEAHKAYSQAVLEGKEIGPHEHRIIRPDGSERTIVTSCVTTERDENGKAIRLTGTVYDITELKTAHKKTTEALQEAERYFNIVPDLVCVASQDGYFKKLNPEWEKLLGYSKEELLSQPLLSFIHPDDVEATLKEIENQLSGGNTLNFTNRYRCKDGSYKWLEWRSAPAVDGLLYAAARDVTEQKKAREALLAREAELERAQAIAHLGNWSWDITTDQTHWSDECYRIFGVDPENFVPNAETVGKLLHPADVARFGRTVNAALAGENVTSCEHRIIRPDGTLRTLLVSGFEIERDEHNQPKRFVAVTQDITERKQAEEALRLSEEKFAKAFLLSPDAVNINRLHDGCYIDINQGFTEIMGYTREDVIGRSSIDGDLGVWFSNEDRAELLKGLMLHGEVNSIEARFRKKDGSVIYGQMSAKMININGEQCIISITRDISARKQTEEALRRSENLLKTTVESAPVVLSMMDLDGIFRLSLGEGLKSLGLQPGQVVGQSVFDVYKDDKATLDVIRKAMRGEVREAEVELVGLLWHCHWSPVLDDNNEITGVVCVATDITRRKRAEEEKRRLERGLEAQKQKFYRETIFNVTQGKLDICGTHRIKNYLSSALACVSVNDASEVSLARREVEKICLENGLIGERLDDFVTAAGEAITNAVKHAVKGRMYAGKKDNTVWVAVQDRGPGIESLALPQAILRKGYSTKPSMGLGYSIMLEVADQILLNTSINGTTVILVKNVDDSLKLSLDSLPDVWAGIKDLT